MARPITCAIPVTADMTSTAIIQALVGAITGNTNLNVNGVSARQSPAHTCTITRQAPFDHVSIRTNLDVTISA